MIYDYSNFSVRSNRRASHPENVCDCSGCSHPVAFRGKLAPVKATLVKKEVDEDDPCTQEENDANVEKLQCRKLRKPRRSRSDRKRMTVSLTEATKVEPYHFKEREGSEHRPNTPQPRERYEEQTTKFRPVLSEEDYCHALADCFHYNQMLRDIRIKGYV
ncbi:hypothetical protein ANCCAN_16720 [Ancylostoma caninum]|uniref:Uncharacterized protein n=1 Tax=Ancylostoma caninum TaxID=29170 RepID=A0A368G430_ANCCA|nr:hypothetical protein ANCCAN_16720 [Ancylostoma caninum]